MSQQSDGATTHATAAGPEGHIDAKRVNVNDEDELRLELIRYVEDVAADDLETGEKRLVSLLSDHRRAMNYRNGGGRE